jgi:hypothetical protein
MYLLQNSRVNLERTLYAQGAKLQPHQSGGPNPAAGADFAQHDSPSQVALDGGQDAVRLIVQLVSIGQQFVVLQHLLGLEPETLESILGAVILGQRLLHASAATCLSRNRV